MTKQYLDKLTYEVIGAAIEVHKELGAGLLESAYHKCLEHELTLRKITFRSQMLVPVNFKGMIFEIELKLDFFVEDCLAVELKSVSELIPIHTAQLMTYMKSGFSYKKILKCRVAIK